MTPHSHRLTKIQHHVTTLLARKQVFGRYLRNEKRYIHSNHTIRFLMSILYGQHMSSVLNTPLIYEIHDKHAI